MPLWAHNVDKDAIVGAQRGQPLWAHNVDSHCGRKTWTAIVGAQRGQPLWAHNVDSHCGRTTWTAILGAQRGQPLWAHNVDSHCGRTTWTAIVGAQRGQPLWAHNVDKDAIVGTERGEGCHCGRTTWRRVPSVPYFAPYKWSHVSGLHPCDWFIRYMAIFSPEECHNWSDLSRPMDWPHPRNSPCLSQPSID